MSPAPHEIQQLYDDYLKDVIEALGICPFAHKSRVQGRVHRPLFFGPSTPAAMAVARDVAAIKANTPDAEIVLATFVDVEAFVHLPMFETFLNEVRGAYASLGAPPFFMVTFHPDAGATPPTVRTPESFVLELRKCPDPVIQCVDAATLERVRKDAQALAHARLLASAQGRPELQAAIASSIATDSQLSSDIARRNFEQLGNGEGHKQLQQRLHAIMAARATLARHGK